MKVRLPLPLLAALAAAFPAATAAPAGTELGNVMFVGDSITHGVNSASYRWALHKIFTDNGISYRAEGVKTGNYSGGVTAGTSYGGQIFNNEHSSQASARAWEISGRSNGSRFDGSNINNWLGLSGTKANGSAYSGQTFTGDNTPDTFFMMIGTNDLLSDGNNATLANRLDSVSQNLLNDMDTIVEAMFQANEHANVIILTIPCWTRHSNGNSDATHQAVAEYNERLKTWGNGRQNVTVIDVNAGIIDVTSSTPFYGVSSMFNNPGSDGLHPNAQGDLLMAGNIARAMGYAGRTAGQERKAAGGLAINFHQGGQSPAWSSNSHLENKGFSLANVTVDENGISLGQSGESSISYSWAEGTDLQNGFTFDCNLVLGNGAADGWDTASDFSISLGNSSFYGTLNINEAYIKWGDAILYSLDMSANAENLRMAYIRGNELEGLKGGYYVWLGDMLIGEALSVTSGSGCNGLTIQYNGSGTAVLHDLALDGTGSYAPATSGNPHILPRLQLCIDDLEQQGVSLILLLCTGEFPAEFHSNVPLIFPDHILKGLIPAISVKNLSVIIPTKAQEEQMPGKWKDCCDSLHVTSVSPYGDPLAVFAAAKEIPADTDLILLDCIGYTIEMKERIQALTQKPVLLSRTLVARVIRELV